MELREAINIIRTAARPASWYNSYEDYEKIILMHQKDPRTDYNVTRAMLEISKLSDEEVDRFIELVEDFHQTLAERAIIPS